MACGDGLPLSDVGMEPVICGRAFPDERIVIFDRVQSSPAHVLRTINQVVLGEAVPDALSGPATQVLVVTSSDDLVVGLEFLVRVFNTAQSLEQLRNLTPLSLTTPPETAQLFLQGGSSQGSTLDVQFETFQTLIQKAIGLCARPIGRGSARRV